MQICAQSAATFTNSQINLSTTRTVYDQSLYSMSIDSLLGIHRFTCIIELATTLPQAPNLVRPGGFMGKYGEHANIAEPNMKLNVKPFGSAPVVAIKINRCLIWHPLRLNKSSTT